MMQESTFIDTVDGRQEVQWWDKEDFRGRVNTLTSSFGRRSIPIPDDSIHCDFCNELIIEFPVPVYRGSYALCKECLGDIKQ